MAQGGSSKGPTPGYSGTKRENADEGGKAEFDSHGKKELLYHETRIEEFLESALPTELKVVLINFEAIEKGECKRRCFPGEIGLSVFSLQSGIIDNCVLYVDHGRKIPQKAISELKRFLDLPSDLKARRNYGDCIYTLKLFREKYKFGEGRNQKALLFYPKSDYEKVVYNLDFLYAMKRRREFQLFPLEYLIARMSEKINSDKRCGYSINRLAGDEITNMLFSNQFDDLSQLACAYHHERHFCYCSLKMVNKYAYNIIRALGNREIATAGIHYPSNDESGEEAKQRENQLQLWSVNSRRKVSFAALNEFLEENGANTGRYNSDDHRTTDGSSQSDLIGEILQEDILVPSKETKNLCLPASAFGHNSPVYVLPRIVNTIQQSPPNPDHGFEFITLPFPDIDQLKLRREHGEADQAENSNENVSNIGRVLPALGITAVAVYPREIQENSNSPNYCQNGKREKYQPSRGYASFRGRNNTAANPSSCNGMILGGYPG